MIVSIHNLPMRTQYKDIKELLLSKCGVSQVLLDKLAREGSGGKSVLVGVATDEDAAIIKKQIDGLYYDGQQLYVQGFGKKKSENQYNAPQSNQFQDYGQGNPSYNQGSQGYNQGSQGYNQGSQGYNQGSQGYDQGAQGNSQGSQNYGQGSVGYNQGSQGYGQGSQGYNQGSQGYKQDSQGYGHGSQGYDKGSQGFNQGGQGYNQGGLGYNQASQGYNQGNPGYGLGNQGANSYPSMSAVASLYDRVNKPAQNQLAAPFGSQSQRPPAPVPSPFGQGGKLNEYPQDYNPRQQKPGPSYSAGASSANRNRSQEPPVGYPEGPWGASGMGGGAQSSRNYRDDSGNDRGPAFDRDRRDKSSNSPGPKSSRWNNASSQADRPEFARKSGRGEPRVWNDQGPQGSQQKGRFGKDTTPEIKPWAGNNQPFQKNQRDDRGPSHSQHPPQARFNDSKPFEPKGRPAFKDESSKKRTWEEANSQFHSDDYGPPKSFRPANMSGPMKSENPYKKGPNQQQNRNVSGPRRPPLGPRGSVFDTPARRFNKCISQGVACILIDNYKMVKESTDPDVYPANKAIRHLYKQRIMDRAYGIVEGRNDLTKKEIKEIYRNRYSERDDMKLYKEVVAQIGSVRTAEDLDQIMKPEEEIESMSYFTKRLRKKAVKKQLATKETLISQLGFSPLVAAPQKPLIPPHPKNNLQLKKQQKKQSKEEIKNMVPYTMGPVMEKCVDEEIEAIAGLLKKHFDNPGGNEIVKAIHGNVNGEAMIDYGKKVFKLHLSKRITNQGTILVRIYGHPSKLLKREPLEKFLNGRGCTSLVKSKSKKAAFFVATFCSYDAADKVIKMGRVPIGPPDKQAHTDFKYMYLTQKPKISYAKILEAHKKLKNTRKFKTNVDLLDKNWPEQELAAKQEAEARKEAAAKREAERQQKLADDKKNDDSTADKTNENGDEITADEKDDVDPKADINIKNDETNSTDVDKKQDISSNADNNIKKDESATTDKDNKDTTTVVDTKVDSEKKNTDNDNKAKQTTDSNATVNKSLNEKDSGAEVLPQHSTSTDPDANLDETGDNWDETGDNWDETGEGWDETTQTVDDSQDKCHIDLDNIDENDLEDY